MSECVLSFNEMTMKELIDYVKRQKKENFSEDYFLRNLSLSTRNVNKLARELRKQYPEVDVTLLETKESISAMYHYLVITYFAELINDSNFFDTIVSFNKKLAQWYKKENLNWINLSNLLSHNQLQNSELLGLDENIKWNNKFLKFMLNHLEVFNSFGSCRYWYYPHFAFYENNYPLKLLHLIQDYYQGHQLPLTMYYNVKKYGLVDMFKSYRNQFYDLNNLSTFILVNYAL